MKIAVLGGSFNPVHIGHLVLADAVCTEAGYDKVLFVPAYCPPHKLMADAESDADRFGMVAAACAADPRFCAESCELDRKGTSYTWDTICWLEQKYAGRLSGKIGLVLGQDLAGEFQKWKNAAQLAQKTEVILAVRPASGEPDAARHENAHRGSYEGGFVAEAALETLPYPHRVLHNVPFPLSSTDIRSRICSGKSWYTF